MRRYIYAIAALVFATGAAFSSTGSPAHVKAQPTPIQHVVVLYLENQSFDAMLGYWCNQPAQVAANRCPDGGMPSQVTLSDGAVVTPQTYGPTIPNLNHSGKAQQAAMNGGAMNGWENIPYSSTNPKIKGCDANDNYWCIGGYQPTSIPNIASLATNFAVSDNTYSLSDSPSWEGHDYAVAASTDGFWGANPYPVKGVTAGPGWGCDSNKVTTWTAPSGKLVPEPSCIPDYALGPDGGAFESTPVAHIPTIMDELDAANPPLSWHIYSATNGQPGYGIWDICPAFADCLDTQQDTNLVPDDQFITDAASGNLPAVSVITPGGDTFPDSCHNAMNITACDNWAGQIAGAVMNSPEWSSTALFITWDDFGGFYDQDYPGTASNPDLTQEGPRVPLIMVSPYVKPGYTDTTHNTFAGILSFIEHTFGLSPLGPNDANADPFTNAFDFTQAPTPRIHMVRQPLPRGALKVPAYVLHDPS